MLIKNNPLSKFEAGISAGLLGLLLVANVAALGYLTAGVRDTLALRQQSSVLPESLSAAKSFAVQATPVGPQELQLAADALKQSYPGIEVSVSRANQLLISSKDAGNFEAFKQTILAAVPQLPGVRWKAGEMCAGNCPTYDDEGRLIATRVKSVAEATASNLGALSVSLTAERLSVAGANAAASVAAVIAAPK